MSWGEPYAATTPEEREREERLNRKKQRIQERKKAWLAARSTARLPRPARKEKQTGQREKQRRMQEALDGDIEKISARHSVAPPLLIELQSTAGKPIRVTVRPDDNVHDTVAKAFHPAKIESVLFGEHPLEDDTLSFCDADIDDGARLSVHLVGLVTHFP